MITRRSRKPLALILATLAVVLVAIRAPAAQPGPADVAEFYRGKTVRFITGYSAGGSFDNMTRLLARHVARYIPGNPTIWVENMTGAGGIVATNYVYNKARGDSTVVLNFDGGLVRLQALGQPGVQFDASRFNWLPSPAPDLQACWVTKASGWSSLAQAIGSSKELKLGGLAPGTFPSDNARILQAALSLNIRLVDGYKGGADIRLAAASGEAEGACMSWEGTKMAYSTDLKNGDIRLIGQVAEKPWPGIEQVPNALEMTKTERGKRLLRVGIIAATEINRLFAMPPDVPMERVDAVRKAFATALQDPAFNAEVEKSKLVSVPMSAERIKEAVELWLRMSETEKEEFRQILKFK